jgi:DNA repair ATPase RecN
MLECLNLIHQLGGFGILAHVDGGGGFEQELPGGSPHKVDVICHSALLGIELKSASSDISYSDLDPDSIRIQAGKQRITRLGLGGRQFLARVLNSDAHSLSALGKNAQGARKVTRIKMDQPSFEGIRIALQDSDARIRIEDHLPQTVPTVLGIHLDGGFLDGQRVHFSPNLNCIIGGRGTGKSTMFEAVRCLSGDESNNPVIDSDIWPSELHLFWRDPAGQIHTLYRASGGVLENTDDPMMGPTSFEIDCFGQGETARISQQAESNPIALLSYLDRFVDLADASAAEAEVRDRLLSLQTEIEKAREKVTLIPQYERSLATAKQQLSALEKANAKEIITLQRQVSEEKEIRSRIVDYINSLQSELGDGSLTTTIDEIRALAQPTQLSVGATELSDILEGIDAFAEETTKARAQVRSRFSGLAKSINEHLTSWRAKEAEALKLIETKRKELEAQNIRLDMAYIQKLANDEATYNQSVINLKTWIPQLKKLTAERNNALKTRWAARGKVSAIREAYARGATRTLREALSDLTVSLKFVASGYSPDGEQLIVEAMGWKTNQVPRARLLVEQLTIPSLLNAIDQKNHAAITQLSTPEGVQPFNKSDATLIMERLGVAPTRFALERCEIHDLPRLTVTKEVPDPSGKPPRYITREFSKLSLGQQQSVLLALMLSSDSGAPLLIDQPEDNLDGEFIYRSLVPVLRQAKERRQIIIVTHNANIAVLGDAEQIIVLKSNSERGMR